MSDESTERPTLRVVRGEPDDAEMAALLTVTAAAAAHPQPENEEPTPSTSRWAERASMLREPGRPGPGVWRASAFPR